MTDLRIPDEHDIAKYPAGLTGWGGCDLNENIAQWELHPARRVIIGEPGRRRGLYKAGTALLPDGTIVTTPCASPSETGGRWPTHIFRSRDNGASWQELGDAPAHGKEPSLTCLRNGVLIMTTEDAENEPARIYRSEDGGGTWTNFALGTRSGTVRGMIEEDDGTVTLYNASRFSDSNFDFTAARYRSADSGRTWEPAGTTEWLVEPAATPEEPHVIRLPDNRLLAVIRVGGTHVIAGTTAPPGFEAGDHLVLTESADNGDTWTPCRDFVGYAKVHGWLTLLADGRLMCTYASYHLPFGVFAVLSNDLGATWDLARPIQIAVSADLYVGWGTSLQLDDGNMLTTYACTRYPNFRDGTNATQSTCEAVHWKLPV